MFVTQHAEARITTRLGNDTWVDEAARLVARLEALPGEAGKVVYLRRLSERRQASDGSNGDVLVMIAVEGSVDTVYFRRATDQSLSAAHFGARKVVTL